MSKQADIASAIVHQGVLPLYFHKDKELSVAVLKVLYEAGIRTVEYTNRGEAALDNFKAMRSLCDNALQGMYLGVGTIKTAEQAKQFLDAGADFLVSPVFDTGVCDVAYLNKVLWVPGCMTPTEIHVATQAGINFIKLFPGNVLGPGFLSAIKELFPGISFMPTGGVELEAGNLSAWFRAGVVAVGMGSKLITKQIMEQKDYDSLRANTQSALQLIAAARG